MLSESDTRAKLIDPAIHSRGWTEDLIRREETAGAIDIGETGPRRRSRGTIDYVLRVKVTPESQPVALALIEAKAEHLPPTHGLEQAKLYASCKRLNVQFVFSSNGRLFIEFDRVSGKTSSPKSLTDFPSPADLRARYERAVGFTLGKPEAKPLLIRYAGGEATRRYYQDAAIRAVLEKIARRGKRALLALATGSGKTFIAVNLLKKIADAGQLRRALFVCDRDELRAQGLAAFQNVFGADAAAVTSDNPQKNARVLVATYQTLDVDREDSDANFLLANYPPDYFSHIVIDECHRSAWGKWSQVLTRNASAVQVGLTATPRRLEVEENTKEAQADVRLTADNIKWFGEPVYEYDMAQGIEDGYLAACEIRRFDLFHDDKTVNERESGVSREDLSGKRIKDAQTGETLTEAEARERYEAENLEDRLLMPERLEAMCRSFFAQLIGTGGPEQKTIIFCRRDRHADDVAACLNNLYADWCRNGNHPRAEPYAFKCTAASSGNEYLADLRGASRRFFIATTVDLLTTGVDVPCVRNIVFFKYVRSPIAFYQMVGRGTRIYAPDGKLMFRVYDYTDATRLFGKEFVTKHQPPRERRAGAVREIPPEPILWVEGFEVKVTDAGRYIVTEEDGKAMPVTVEEYKERLAERLVKEAPTLEEFRAVWIVPSKRRELIEGLPDGGRSAPVIRSLEGMLDYDLYDVLAELGYGLDPKTRLERTDAFAYKHEKWLKGLPEKAAAVIQAIAAQFAKAGTEGLENPAVFDTPEVVKAGGLSALKKKGKPAEILMETKQKMFAA
ncbi:MAG TPA: DEAD/DEAH box helicase family protein [Candidatus Aminicenantes bacterium]|nr:DEAD/DEAH box helicase family protein [Candidatus Aminicenantes bacterium]HQH46075.1 DEAD/DEAH box helicase family protein [Candidatus Aminicenantes bacterium]